MKHLMKIAIAIAGAVALLSAAPAMADRINFESLDPMIYGGTETFNEASYQFEVIDSPASPDGTGLAGMIGDGADPYLCAVAACPTGNSSHFYLGVNDGSLKIAREDQLAFRLYALDYAFLAPVGGLGPYSYGQLVVTGTTVGGGSMQATFDFPALVGGASPFSSANLAAQFGTTLFRNVTISSCVFDDVGCINPSGNQAQFALDNLVLAAVPEPETYAMFGLGLAAIGLVARRRAKQLNNA